MSHFAGSDIVAGSPLSCGVECFCWAAMQIHRGERQADISVREFAEFQAGPTATVGRRAGLWRAQVGTAWHQRLQAEQDAAEGIADFEVDLKVTWLHGGWRLNFHGRIDQVVHASGAERLFREVKTTTPPLPLPEDELLAGYPHYLVQLAAYLMLGRELPAYREVSRRGELLFVDIASGITQAVDLSEAEAKTLFERKLDELVRFLEGRWSSKMALSELSFKPAFKTLRAGQDVAFEQLRHLAQTAPQVLFEAPTGFGKTGAVLEFALEQLRAGKCERVIYLTSKSSGQLQAVRQLKAMLPEEGGPRFFQLRNKGEHAQRCPIRGCDGRSSCGQTLEKHARGCHFSPQEWFDHNGLPMDRICSLAGQTGLCPYELSRALLPYAEIWICDYNYVFNPQNQSVLWEQFDFEPHRSLLIVDEAHNLPERVADAWSAADSRQEMEEVVAELDLLNAPRALCRAARNWLKLLENLKPAERLDPIIEYDIADSVKALAEALRDAPLPYDELSAFTADKLYAALRIQRVIERTEIPKLFWCPAPGRLRISCLEAASPIMETLKQFGQSILMSATLSPTKIYLEQTGLPGATTPFIAAEASWRDDAYSVAVDTRVDTRLRTREQHYLKTTQTIAALIHDTNGPVAVFFPSYRYAETIRTYLEAQDSMVRVALQPRAVDLNGQLTFVEESLLAAHVMFFVLGSNFSESIDLLGGRVGTAMIVGPALPEVNALQKAKLEACQSLGQPEAFRRVYQIPAIRKINQALGRFVRAPGQRARVLLHCRRFAEASYANLLSPEYLNTTLVRNDDAFLAWLQGQHRAGNP